MGAVVRMVIGVAMVGQQGPLKSGSDVMLQKQLQVLFLPRHCLDQLLPWGPGPKAAGRGLGAQGR